MATITFDRLAKRMTRRRLDYQINVSWKNRYVYVETPKAACSSIKRHLHKIELMKTPYEPPADVHDRSLSPLLRPLQMPERAFTECMTSPEWFRFAFVRNPYTRVLSAYLDKIQRNRPEKKEILNSLGRDPKELEAEVSFLEFLQAIRKTPNGLRDNHWRPQVQLLFIGQCDYHVIGAFERLEQDVAYVTERMGVTRRFKLDNVGNHATDAASALKEWYTGEVMDVFESLYDGDFRTFGYSRSLDETAEPPRRRKWAIGERAAG